MTGSGLFQPKRDDGRSYWRIVFDRFSSAAHGEIVTHSELTSLIGQTDRSLLYASVSRAAKELRKRCQRDVASLRGEGYRILLANEHVTKAEVHKQRATQQLKIANEVVDATDLAALTSSERELWGKVKRGMVLMYQAITAHEAELERHESLIQSLQHRVDTLEQNN